MDSIIKKFKTDFTIVPNSIWESSLNDKTIRIIGWMLSKPDHWTFNKSYMCERLDISPSTLQRRLNEASRKGWLKISNVRLENGAFTYNQYEVMDGGKVSKNAPVTNDTPPLSQMTPPPLSQMTPLSNTDSFSNTDKKKITKVISKVKSSNELLNESPFPIEKENILLLLTDEDIQHLEDQLKQKENLPSKKVARKKDSLELMEKAKDVIETLNQFSGRKFPFDPDGKGPANGTNNLTLVLKLYKKGVNFEDIKDMVIYKCYEWANDIKMKKYLQPTTLFSREKSMAYVQTAIEAKDNPAIKEMIDKSKEQQRQRGELTGGLVNSTTAEQIYQSIF